MISNTNGYIFLTYFYKPCINYQNILAQYIVTVFSLQLEHYERLQVLMTLFQVIRSVLAIMSSCTTAIIVKST